MYLVPPLRGSRILGLPLFVDGNKLFQINVLSFYSPKFSFRILIQFSESKFSFSDDISPFYVVIYNSKTCIGILNTDLDSKSKLELKQDLGGTLNSQITV